MSSRWRCQELLPLGANSINLINKNNRRCILLSNAEQFTNLQHVINHVFSVASAYQLGAITQIFLNQLRANLSGHTFVKLYNHDVRRNLTIRKNVAEVELATALASNVLPVPGTPYRITPETIHRWIEWTAQLSPTQKYL